MRPVGPVELAVFLSGAEARRVGENVDMVDRLVVLVLLNRELQQIVSVIVYTCRRSDGFLTYDDCCKTNGLSREPAHTL